MSLTPAGADSAVTRLVDDRAANLTLWTKLPYLMDYQDPGTVKPGATELAQMRVGGRTLPLLVTETTAAAAPRCWPPAAPGAGR